MVDDRAEDIGPSPDVGRAKRTPPTIDLEASEVSGETRNAGDDPQPKPEPERVSREPSAAAISPWLVAAVSGAVAAALVIGVGWILGWPAVSPVAPAATEINAAVIDGLSARVASVESKANKPATPETDPAAAARIEALGRALRALSR